MTKYCAIFGICILLAFVLLSMIELSFNVALWPRNTRVTLGLVVTATALILVGMHNDK